MLPFFPRKCWQKLGQNEEKVRFFSSGRASEKNLTFGGNFWSRLTLFFFLLLLEFANSFFSHISINHCNASRVSSAEGNPLMWLYIDPTR